MSRNEPTKSPVASVAVFPPLLHATCEVKQTRDQDAIRFQRATDNPPMANHDREEEEPERWDGMS